MTNKSGYEIGYGKPPRATQFKPGKSGNPKGRKSAKAAILEETAKIISEPVSRRSRGGRKQKLAAMEVAYLQLCKKALAGDKTALIEVMRSIRVMIPDVQSKDEEQLEEQNEMRRELAIKLGLNPDDLINC
jgi:hypothetical protein